MPAQLPEVSPELLEREILHLLPAVREGRGGSSGQQKSELAGLLFEAHRTAAHREWGFKNLGQYAATKLELNPKTFAKYKTAGKFLHDNYRGMYQALLAAVLGRRPRPQLPTVSELAAMPSLEKQVGRSHLVTELLHEGASLSKVTALAEMTSYDGANAEGRRALSELDAFVQEAKRTRGVLLGLQSGHDHIPAEQLARRVANIREACDELLRTLRHLETDEP